MRKLFFIFSIFIFNSLLFANLILKAPDSFVKDESYIFEFEVSGSSIVFPKIENIDGFVVEDLGTSRSLQIINGNYDEKISKKFRIIPNKEFTIPSFEFTVDGEKVLSKLKSVKQIQIEKTTSDNFDLTLVSTKKELFVGEDLIVKLIFKYKRGLQITNLGFESPHFDNFWYKKIDNSNKRYEENGYVVQELDFLLFPQKSGKLKIDPLRVDVQMIESRSNSNISFFGAVPKVTKVYSNNLFFDVKELPNSVNLIGDFNIKASIDKKKIKLGESITYRLSIKGLGNFDDIKDFKLDINDATIYDNKPEIKTNYTKNGLEGKYTKVFSVIPNKSLEIPAIKLSYFNKKEKKVVTKKSDSFKIEVIGEKKEEVVLQKPTKKIEKKEIKKVVEEEISTKDKLLYFLFGAFFTLLIFGLYIYVRLQKSKRQKKETSLIKLVKSSNNKDQLMKSLIPYLKIDDNLDKLIFKCQSDNMDFKILKKEILNILKELKL